MHAQTMAARFGRPKHAEAEAGFSLIELMVTVLILGVLLGFAALSYAGITRDNALSAATKQVESAMKRAKAFATQENVTYIVTFFSDAETHPNTYAFFRPGNLEPEQNKSVPGESNDAGYISMENGVKITSTTSITITPSGTTLSVTAATVALEMGGRNSNVNISSTGTITL